METELQEMDDAHLIRGHLRGDTLAFEMLFRKYRDHVSHLVYSVLKDESLVDDIVQEVFISVYRNLHKFRGDAAFKTWLYRIVVNESLRQSGKARRYVPLPEGDEEASRVPTTLVVTEGKDNPERVMITGQKKAIIEEAMAALKPKHRLILTLYYLEDFSVGEIAETLEIPEGSVKSRLFYARDRLKTVLEPYISKLDGAQSLRMQNVL